MPTAEVTDYTIIENLLETIQSTDNPDWFAAVYLHALDEVKDANEALEIAKQVMNQRTTQRKSLIGPSPFINRKCMEGPNRGKPGICPEQQHRQTEPMTTRMDVKPSSERKPASSPIGKSNLSSPKHKQLAQSPVKSATFTGGERRSTQTFILELVDGTKGVFKPASGERSQVTTQSGRQVNLREGVQGGTYFRREVAASAVADLLGFSDLVPVTVFRDMQGEVGSIQDFVAGAEDAFAVPDSEMFDGEEDAARAAVFDYLLGHLDRHEGNWMLRGGKLVLIDNGLSFPTKYDGDDFFNMRFWDHARSDNLQIPKEVRQWKGKWPELEKTLREAGLEDEAIELTKNRLSDLSSSKSNFIKDLPALVGNGTLGDLVYEKQPRTI